MVTLFSMLIVMFAFMFWGLRIIVAVTASLELDFAVQTLNLTAEIILLFVTLAALILVVRRNMIGALVYLISYGIYFGIDLYMILSRGVVETAEYASVFISAVAMILALLVYIDMAFSKDEKNGQGKRSTNWFYKTDQYVREKEEWEDKNQYKY